MKYVIGYLSLIVTFDLDKHVTRIEHPFRDILFIAAHLNDFFLRQQILGDLVCKLHIADTGTQALDHFVLVSRMSVDKIPLLHLKYPYTPAILLITHVSACKIWTQ